MIELIATIIFFTSLVAIAMIVFRKIPVLLGLPETVPSQFDWKELLIKIKNLLPFRNFSFEIFLQKILSKIRILTLKTDNKTSSWLQKLREKSQRKKFGEDDNYWEKVKKSTKK
ncbi:MAG: hypothetical protein NT012_03530 [Candidatus Nealsonbacteria bacterium]|nr:hypothetical protein [Candidatus Nealsonbacteria bacterium]